MVYKLVEVDGRPVAKRSSHKQSRGGRKSALRRYKPTGTALEELVFPVAGGRRPDEHERLLPVPVLRDGRRVEPPETLDTGRERLRAALVAIPWEGLKLSHGEPALPTTFEEA
jgi:nicotinate phosphoribosyltransferase